MCDGEESRGEGPSGQPWDLRFSLLQHGCPFPAAAALHSQEGGPCLVGSYTWNLFRPPASHSHRK